MWDTAQNRLAVCISAESAVQSRTEHGRGHVQLSLQLQCMRLWTATTSMQCRNTIVFNSLTYKYVVGTMGCGWQCWALTGGIKRETVVIVALQSKPHNLMVPSSLKLHLLANPQTVPLRYMYIAQSLDRPRGHGLGPHQLIFFPWLDSSEDVHMRGKGGGGGGTMLNRTLEHGSAAYCHATLTTLTIFTLHYTQNYVLATLYHIYHNTVIQCCHTPHWRYFLFLGKLL